MTKITADAILKEVLIRDIKCYKMKIIKIFLIGYIWGIILCNLIAFIIWFNDPATSSMDIPTILLTCLFSLAWPVALFGDFMASRILYRKIIDIIILTIPFVFGYYSNKLITKKFITKQST